MDEYLQYIVHHHASPSTISSSKSAKLLSPKENVEKLYSSSLIDMREYIDCSLTQPASLVLVGKLCCQ
jgi:hypothetical protein